MQYFKLFLQLITYLIEVEWHIYASMNKNMIGSDNGLTPVRRQVISETDVVL